MTASSPASWSRFSPPSNFINGHVSTMWFMVHGLLLATITGRWLGETPFVQVSKTWPVQKRFIRDHVWRGRSKHGCRIVGSVTIVCLTTEADDQSSLHCVIVSTDVMSDHIGRRDASRGGGCSKTSAYRGQFGWASMIWSMLSVTALQRREGGATLLSTGSHESCVGCRQSEIRRIELWGWVSSVWP